MTIISICFVAFRTLSNESYCEPYSYYKHKHKFIRQIYKEVEDDLLWKPHRKFQLIFVKCEVSYKVEHKEKLQKYPRFSTKNNPLTPIIDYQLNNRTKRIIDYILQKYETTNYDNITVVSGSSDSDGECNHPSHANLCYKLGFTQKSDNSNTNTNKIEGHEHQRSEKTNLPKIEFEEETIDVKDLDEEQRTSIDMLLSINYITKSSFIICNDRIKLKRPLCNAYGDFIKKRKRTYISNDYRFGYCSGISRICSLDINRIDI